MSANTVTTTATAPLNTPEIRRPRLLMLYEDPRGMLTFA
jgi:hypothetical protein